MLATLLAERKSCVGSKGFILLHNGHAFVWTCKFCMLTESVCDLHLVDNQSEFILDTNVSVDFIFLKK